MDGVLGQLAHDEAKPDEEQLRRLQAQRDRAYLEYQQPGGSRKKFARRLDELEAEAQRLRSPKTDQAPSPATARKYLGELGHVWRTAEVGDGRRHLAEALFERVDVLGGQLMTVHVTELAISNGFSPGVVVTAETRRSALTAARTAIAAVLEVDPESFELDL